ncbi:MAG: glycine cleavage system protein GcvH [Candidatus Hydrogenedentota bacterium]|nr:MAG: glycine cleavage system protein GcvH [Candidatus Hydrogenedentota bacterium]
MSQIPEDLQYTEEHEWVQFTSEDEVVVGITDYAQDSLGDIVFVELPEANSEVEKGSSVATIESVKAVSDIYAPLSGTITAVNEAVTSDPGIINKSPYEEGWLFKIKVSNPAEKEELLTAEAYKNHIESLSS